MPLRIGLFAWWGVSQSVLFALQKEQKEIG